MQYKQNYQRRPIGWLPRSIIFLLLAAVLIRIIYRQMNHDHQYENVAFLPKANILDEIKREPEPVFGHKKIDATNRPRMHTLDKVTDKKNEQIDLSPKAEAPEPMHINTMEQNEDAEMDQSDSEQQIVEQWIDDKTPESSYIETIAEIIEEPENNEEQTEIQTSNKDSQLELEMKIRLLTNCKDKNFKPKIYRRGDYWVLQNYIRAYHGEIPCTESVTYVTHGDYTFLDNMIPVLERWSGPLSMAIYTPGTDLQPTIDSIKYLRQCLPQSNLVRNYATFHIFFDSEHVPDVIPKSNEVLSESFNCSLPPPYLNVDPSRLYKNQQNMTYPINVARNAARDAALTHFLFVCDIELYPSPDLPRKFLEMIAQNEPPLNTTKPKVFPLNIFEVDESSHVPWTKSELQEMYKNGTIIPFHKKICGGCHKIPEADKWMKANETEDLGIFTVGKRKGSYTHWEPIFIGTNDEPYYDERLSWEGKSEKMTQSQIMCYLDYEFHILDNAFLVHRPGIKTFHSDTRRNTLSNQSTKLINDVIEPHLKIIYGHKDGC